ncbi:MAG: hypothetical protein AB7U98_00635 [Candidatus Nitrosocosmicus sp.]|jgi:hypothetical protein|uniref:hypothetical protein n=1 Tax=Candidatus Nitrosocosmicus sp. FF01 TaxID=3397670 RepID=UPI002A6EC887|nr:hypothetical protein [Candidatus Nitrosocosmicus sp.]
MNTNLTVLVIMISVASTTISATATIATQEIFAQNQNTYMDHLINECMYNNVTACNALEHYNSTEFP